MLGGKYSTALKSTSTHLVIDKAIGAKYDSCAKLDVVPVTIAWLWDTARQGALSNGCINASPFGGLSASCIIRAV